MWADEATIRLSVIGVGSRPEIWKLEAVEGGLWLQCRSNGWFPKPEMFWLDSDGRNLTSESGNVPKFNYTLVEGLYTVTGEVAVTRGDANRFLCRIHFQKNNLTTETEINISGNTFPNSDDLFWKLWDIYKTTAAFSGLVILLIIPGFILHKKGVFERLGYFSKQLRFLKYRNPPGYEDIIQNRVSVKLDSCRAHSHLRVDCDCEQVSYQGPGSPQSQQQSKCEYGVLGTNQFSGKHYFEVKFEGSWVVGVARDPIDITSTINYGHDAWTLSRNNGKLRVHNGSLVLLSDQQKSDTMYIMGVYVDYQDKRVSFYNVNPNVRPCHIYSYTECDFSENLCPFFRTWNARRNVLKVNNTDNAAKDGKCEEELSIY